MDSFLENSVFKKPKYAVRYNGKDMNIQIYDDDTVKDVLI